MYTLHSCCHKSAGTRHIAWCSCCAVHHIEEPLHATTCCYNSLQQEALASGDLGNPGVADLLAAVHHRDILTIFVDHTG